MKGRIPQEKGRRGKLRASASRGKRYPRSEFPGQGVKGAEKGLRNAVSPGAGKKDDTAMSETPSRGCRK